MTGNIQGLAGRDGERVGLLFPWTLKQFEVIHLFFVNILPTLHPVKFSGRRSGLTFGPASIRGPRVTETSADITGSRGVSCE